jgi:hypothetical protein
MLWGLLLALAIGCTGDSGGSSSARLSRRTSAPTDLPTPLQFEAGRNFVTEYEDFQAMVNEQHAAPEAIREALGVTATRQFTYKSASGSDVFGWEFEFQGPHTDAPFFEAFAAGYPGKSFFVFFEKSWFSWRAMDCGFHETGVFGSTPAEG